MIYRNGYSILGFGCMRFPKNYEETERLLLRAMEGGVNYFDTAYIYPGSEAVLGKVLAKNQCRDQVRIATKLPHYLVKTGADLERLFQTELKRLQTDYVDNYLIHMLPDVSTWERLKNLGIEAWIAEKKAKGQIKNIGFSFHGSTPLFLELLEVHPWDFCLIQYNYMDEHSQAGKAGLQAAYAKGIAVVIMEPLRGGNLVHGLSQEAKAVFAKTGRSPADWGLSWLYAQKEVTCVLSGMNTMEMLEENIAIASREAVFAAAEVAVMDEARAAISAATQIPCTGCGYCMPCPAGVDIPGCFRCYNVSYTEGYRKAFHEYISSTTLKAKRGNAALCRKCGLCEKHCPQHLPIRDNLHLVKRRFETLPYHLTAFVAKFAFRGVKKTSADKK